MKNREKLFRHFGLNVRERSTIRKLSLQTKIPYMTLNRMVKELQAENIVKSEKVGKAAVIQLNLQYKLTKHHLVLASEAFSNEFAGRRPLIRKIIAVIRDKSVNDISAILFGSYAAGKEQKHSDLDIAFISNTDIKTIVAEFRTIEQIHDIKINIMKFTEKQFIAMLRQKTENVGKQILGNHVILFNPELFWNCVYEGFR